MTLLYDRSDVLPYGPSPLYRQVADIILTDVAFSFA
jgi:hypothetical protein